MFKDTKAFSSFAVDNLETADQFYRGMLKLEVSRVAEMPILKLHINGGIDIVVYEKPNHVPATFTVLNFPVKEITSTVSDLKGRGVMFEAYDFPGLKTDEDNIVRGGGPLIAWFKDPAGNILSVIESEE